MRNKLRFFCILLAVLAILLVAVVAVSSDRRDRDIIAYNVLKERMFEGVVASKGRIIEGLVYFPLKTGATIWEVQIGPKEFVERSGFKLNPGDTVTVIGMPLVMNERHVVLAREVSSMNRVLIVRDQVGLPLWEKDRPILMDPERRIRPYEECELIR
jgi:hypothetical protein